MVLMAEPQARAVEAASEEQKPFVVLTSPQGVRLDQALVESLAAKEHLLFVCGHYEGVDERFTRTFADMEISLGDFVLTGGELPALAATDAIARLVPGVVGRSEAVVEDSFYQGFLDCPHETRPARWRGMEAEPVLRGGDHASIVRWRRREAVRRTLERRPDLIARAGMMSYLSHGVYALWGCDPSPDGGGFFPADLRNLALAVRTYGLRRLLVVASEAGRRESIRFEEPVEEPANLGEGKLGSDRFETPNLIKPFPDLGKALSWVAKKEKGRPFVVGVDPRRLKGAEHWVRVKLEILRRDVPLVLLLETGGLRREALERCDALLVPIRGDGESCLSVPAVAAVILDRFFGRR
jgi:tRNA (guanine37-N1)-methyltransferase